MAARVRKIRHDEQTRAKIQASQLINRLQDHVFGKAEISQSQMKAIEILLKKSLPDMSAVALSGDEDNPVAVSDISDIEAGRRIAFVLRRALAAQTAADKD